MVGGGLVRSLGGWSAIKKPGLKSIGRVKGDDRILGDSEFVHKMLKKADDRFDRYYELKQLGYNLERGWARVCKIYDVSVEDIYSKSREKVKAEARGLFCYWAVRELGYSMLALARRLGMSQPGVVYAVRRGERLATETGLKLASVVKFSNNCFHKDCLYERFVPAAPLQMFGGSIMAHSFHRK